jgi:hypothetical protein
MVACLAPPPLAPLPFRRSALAVDAVARRCPAAAACLATVVAAVAAPRLAPAIVVVVVAATVVARVAAARRCFSAAVARLVIRRPHTVVVACRQARRHRVVRSSVGTLPAVVLALALPSCSFRPRLRKLPRARRAPASTHCRPNLLTRTARAASNLATTCPPRHEDWRILSFIRLQWSPPELLFIHRRALRMSC